LSLKLRYTLALIGFTATVAQVVLLRELLVISYGNEMSLGVMLASWLLWTALGSAILGQFATGLLKPAPMLATLQVVLAFSFPATILAVRAGRGLFHAMPGELLGPTPILLVCLLTLSGFCAASGWAFVAGTRFYEHEVGSSTPAALNSVYLLEAAGSALGGILTSLILLRFLNPLQIALFVSMLNLMAGALLLVKSVRSAAAACTLFAVWFLAGLPEARRWEARSLAALWPGFRIVDSRNSVYGNLAVVETGSIRSLAENGLLMFNAPDPASAEEAVHFALLQHPTPRTLLLIGGGAGGSLQQALQHPSLESVDYVELDPTILKLADEYFPEQWIQARNDQRVHVHHMDGRLFLKTTRQAFDVIIVNLPAPQTAQLNRFYTVDFFREAAEKLATGGILSFQLHAAEEYLTPDLSAFLRCVVKSLHEAFPNVRLIPGDIVHFVAAKEEASLAADSDELLARLRARHLQTKYVREYYIPFRMMPDRVADLEQKLEPRPDTPINYDLAPIAYYFDVALWSTQFNRKYEFLFESVARLRFGRLLACSVFVLLTVAFVIGFLPRRASRVRGSAVLCVALAGLTMLSLEVLLLLGFQVIYGYVYHQLAVLIALFMAGLALGAYWRLHRAAGDSRSFNVRAALMKLAGLQGLTSLSPVLLYAVLGSFSSIRSLGVLSFTSGVVFPMMALLAGALGGYEFALATDIYFAGRDAPRKSFGILYGVDLLGASLGALTVSALLLPLFGFLKASAFIAALSVVPALLALSAGLLKWDLAE
jgi:spermidine synthase